MTDSFNLNRSQRLSIMQEQTDWDIVIIGGGITGAGILKLASQLGLKALLLEQNDFSWVVQVALQKWFTEDCAILRMVK